MPKRPAPKKGQPAAPEIVALNMNVPLDLLAALDGWAEKLNADPTGSPRWTRSDVIRAALWRAVKERGEKGEAP
jgi:hypothetical protein